MKKDVLWVCIAVSAGETAEVRVARGSQPSSQGEVRSTAGLGS